MDQYGCMQLTKDDAKDVRRILEHTGSIVFPLSGDQIGAMIIFISTKFFKLGTMPFGGNPSGRAYVGVYKKGCGHLSMDKIHPGYIAENLNLGTSDAETFATFWSMIWDDK